MTNVVHVSFTWLEEATAHPGLLLLAEVGCLCLYAVDIGLKAGYFGRKDYLAKRWHRGLLVIVALFAADVCERAVWLGRTHRLLRQSVPFASKERVVSLDRACRLPRQNVQFACHLP